MTDPIDSRIDAAVRARRETRAPEALHDAVMRRVRAAPAPAAQSSAPSLLSSLWRPRQIAVRPAWALAAMVLIALSAALLRVDRAPSAAPPVYVQFRIEASGASDVRLAGSFTDWEPRHELIEAQPGLWTVLVALEPGVHDYAFLVDGSTWVADPTAAHVDDGFGGQNSRLSLLPES